MSEIINIWDAFAQHPLMIIGIFVLAFVVIMLLALIAVVVKENSLRKYGDFSAFNLLFLIFITVVYKFYALIATIYFILVIIGGIIKFFS